MQVSYIEPGDSGFKLDSPIAAGERAAVVTGLLEDEPVFVIRGRDAVGMAVLNIYRSATEGLFSNERALTLEADVQAFVDWRRSAIGQAALRDPD